MIRITNDNNITPFFIFNVKDNNKNNQYDDRFFNLLKYKDFLILNPDFLYPFILDRFNYDFRLPIRNISSFIADFNENDNRSNRPNLPFILTKTRKTSNIFNSLKRIKNKLLSLILRNYFY